jgi:hypothetical protein
MELFDYYQIPIYDVTQNKIKCFTKDFYVDRMHGSVEYMSRPYDFEYKKIISFQITKNIKIKFINPETGIPYDINDIYRYTPSFGFNELSDNVYELRPEYISFINSNRCIFQIVTNIIIADTDDVNKMIQGSLFILYE